MATEFLNIIPVLPSADIDRDIEWYVLNLGFEVIYADEMYAVLHLGKIWMHLQWHADTPNDPLLGGSVIRIYTKDINPIFNDLFSKGVVDKSKMKVNTPWKTNEFGLYDLNNNAIFIMEDATLIE